MSDFNSEQKRRRKHRARKQRPGKRIILLVYLVVIVPLVISLGSRLYTNYITMEGRLKKSRVESLHKKERIQELEQQRVELNNPEHLKELARKQLYYMDKNEVHIKISPNPSGD